MSTEASGKNNTFQSAQGLWFVGALLSGWWCTMRSSATRPHPPATGRSVRVGLVIRCWGGRDSQTLSIEDQVGEWCVIEKLKRQMPRGGGAIFMSKLMQIGPHRPNLHRYLPSRLLRSSVLSPRDCFGDNLHVAGVIGVSRAR